MVTYDYFISCNDSIDSEPAGSESWPRKEDFDVEETAAAIYQTVRKATNKNITVLVVERGTGEIIFIL